MLLTHKTSSYFNLKFLAAFVFVFYVYLALFSFNTDDPSWFSLSYPENPTKNLAGSLGAQMASVLLHFFGFVAYFFPLLLVSFFKRYGLIKIKGWVATITTCFTLSFYFSILKGQTIFYDLPFNAGGLVGFLLERISVPLFGYYGSLLVAAFLLFFTLSLLFHVPLLSFSFFYLPKKMLRFFSKKKENARKSLEQDKPIEFWKDEIRSVFPKPEPGIKDESIQLKTLQEHLQTVLKSFQIKGEIVGAVTGPRINTYYFQPEAGEKQSKIFTLAGDIALSLQAHSILLTPAPHKKALAIEVPNHSQKEIGLHHAFQSHAFQKETSPLSFAIGLTNENEVLFDDLKKIPHLLVAGATGSGKSVCLNTIICTILSKSTPDEVRTVFIDPKHLELKIYENTPHSLCPIITEADKAQEALDFMIDEMEQRYQMMEKVNARNLDTYNQLVEKNQRLPYYLIVIDEVADLFLSNNKVIPTQVLKLCQKARACGIHLILATQRPSVDIITGIIKANFPGRIALRVASKYDSRTILDQKGAESLLGAGDLLYLKPGGQLIRAQGFFVTEHEILTFISLLSRKYNDPIFLPALMARLQNSRPNAENGATR